MQLMLRGVFRVKHGLKSLSKRSKIPFDVSVNVMEFKRKSTLNKIPLRNSGKARERIILADVDAFQ